MSRNLLKTKKIVQELFQKIAQDRLSWWKRLLDIPADGRRDTSLRVGIIDVGPPFGAVEEVTQLDLDGYPTTEYATNSSFHGYNVSSIFVQSRMFERGNIFYCDAAHDDDPTKICLSKLRKCIYNLVLENDVDFINISCGKHFDISDPLDERDKQGLADALELADKVGCTVVAATGNEPAYEPGYPASHELVLGVGSVGQIGLAPKSTVSHEYETEAFTLKLISDELGGVYVDPKCSIGDGLNFLAPGVSVFVEQSSDVTIELIGTSFASPAAILAICWSMRKSREYENTDLASRAKFVRELAIGNCYDIGLPSNLQGAGLIQSTGQ